MANTSAIQGIRRATTIPELQPDAPDWFRHFIFQHYVFFTQQVQAVHSAFQQFQLTTTVGNATKAVTFTFPYPDTAYALAAMADWNTAIWFSAKAKGSVTLNFSVASPGNNNVTLLTTR